MNTLHIRDCHFEPWGSRRVGQKGRARTITFPRRANRPRSSIRQTVPRVQTQIPATASRRQIRFDTLVVLDIPDRVNRGRIFPSRHETILFRSALVMIYDDAKGHRSWLAGEGVADMKLIVLFGDDFEVGHDV